MKFHFFYTQGRPLSAGDWDTQTLFFLSTGIGSSTTGGSLAERRILIFALPPRNKANRSTKSSP